MPAIVVAGGLAAAGAIGGAAISASSQKKAANKAVAAQTAITDKNNALAQENRDFLNAKITPFYDRGNAAGATINALSGLGGDVAAANNAFRTYIDNSDYAFRRNEGERGLAAKLSQAGGVESGAAIKATQQYGKNLDAGYRGDYFNVLGNQQAVGVSGVNALAGVGTNFTNQVTNNNQNLADAQSNGALIKGAANANFGATVGNALGQFAGSVFSGGGFGGSFGKAGGGSPFAYSGRPTQYGGWI
jgi:hypothetical protein